LAENANHLNIQVVDITEDEKDEDPRSVSGVSVSSGEDSKRTRRLPQVALGYKGDTDGWKFFKVYPLHKLVLTLFRVT
jgi:hypothetical protein